VNDNVLAEREEAINDINKTLMQVNDIFHELADLVEEQGTGIEEIAGNIDITNDRAKAGLNEIKIADDLNRKRSRCVIA
jgi:methyl-accepting chemotaxis protein